MYFAYGSNMDTNELMDRSMRFSQRRHAVLRGYDLRFNKIATNGQKGEGKGNVVKIDNEVVEGALYDIFDSDIKRLDVKEGYPDHYDKINITLELDDRTTLQAMAYIAQPDMVREGLKPTKKYLKHYLKGKDILSEPYYRKLSSTKTLD